MDLTGVRLNCMSRPTDRKQVPSFQPYRRFSTATSIPNKMVHFPYERLTGNKVEETSICYNGIDNGTLKPTAIDKTNVGLFRNFSKNCHQLPGMGILSELVASKSQVHSAYSNREPQIWNNTIRRFGEFVRSNCNLLLGPDNPAVEFILPNASNCNIKTCRAEPVEPSQSKQNSPALMSKSNENKHLSNPSVILNISEHFCEPLFLNRQPFIANKDTNTQVKSQTSLEFAGEPVILYRYSVVEHPVLIKPEVKVEYNSNPPESSKPIPIFSKEKSYAEVAKMCRGRVRHDIRDEKVAKPSRRYSKKNYFGHNRPKSFQRSVDNTNWREQNSEIKDIRRDKFLPVHSKDCVFSDVKPNSAPVKCKPQSQCTDTKINRQKYQKRNHGRYNNDRHNRDQQHRRKPVVHEKHPNYDKKHNVEEELTVVESCQYYNPKEKSCKNWRCRQHPTKSSLSQDISDSSLELSPKNRIKNTCQFISKGFNREQSSRTPTESCAATTKSLPAASPEHSPMKSLSKLKEISMEAINHLRRRSFSENKDSLLTSLSRATLNCVGNRDIGSFSSSNSGSVRRSLSECSVDSEDSFVIFGEVNDGEKADSEESDLSSDWSECETESDDEVDACASRNMLLLCIAEQFEGDDDDHYDVNDMSPRLREVNQRWAADNRCSTTRRRSDTAKKVCFASTPPIVHPIVAWEYAYRAARCGPWEEYARDRERFRLRVLRCEPTLSAVLRPEHREMARQRNQQRCAEEEVLTV